MLLNESKLKGSLLFKEMLDRYLKVLEREDANIEDAFSHLLFSLLNIFKDTLSTPFDI